MTASSKLTLLAIERLLSVKAAILAEPELYDQSTWAPPGSSIIPKRTACKTPSCLFGWAIALGGLSITRVDGVACIEQEIYCFAAEWLGLEHNVTSTACHREGGRTTQADRLYHLDLWPAKFGLALVGHGGVAAADDARVAAERIDHFIATDGAE